MTYTKEQFLDDVKAEAKALREHATKEELGKLDIRNLDANNPHCCVYGQLTGDCDSDRATVLMKRCANVYFMTPTDGLNFCVTEKFAYCNWSPIECYIRLPQAQNANLIVYLRGETDDLNL